MNVPTRFVEPLTEPQVQTLEQLWKQAPSHRPRTRALALGLGHKPFSLEQIADICAVTRDTVGRWLEAWEQDHEASWHDAPRSGAPPRFDSDEQARIGDLLQEHPHQPKQVQARLEEETGKVLTGDILRRVAHEHGFRGKRLRRSSKLWRDDEEFAEAQEDLYQFVHYQQAGHIDLYFLKETGFSLQPSVPYGWRPEGEHKEIPSQRGRRWQVLGFWGPEVEFCWQGHLGAVTSEVVIDVFEDLCARLERETVVVLDNASMHTSGAFAAKLAEWERQGLHISYLPPYSPELNWIERLWKQINYHWLLLSAYHTLDTLIEAVEDIPGGLRHTG